MASPSAASPAVPEPGGVREIETPEGVPIRIRLGARSERAFAVLIDLAIIVAGVLGLALLVDYLQTVGLSPYLAMTLWLVATFVLRSFYFIFFELRWQGRTPGKRLLRLKVVDRKGGRLRADAVFARNLMREVELFLPITLLLAMMHSGFRHFMSTGFIWLWIIALCVLPLFNRDRLRAGDMVAGTWVVKLPRTPLLPDVAESRAAEAADFDFTREQLAVYGIHELQTLEGVLRRTGRYAQEAHRTVAERIRNRIEWREPEPDPAEDRAFLEAFYSALREDLERRMLFGERRADKHHQDAPAGAETRSPG